MGLVGLPSAGCMVCHGSGTSPDMADAECRARTVWQSADELLANPGASDSPTVLLVDASMLDRLEAVRAVPQHVVVVAADAESQAALGRGAHMSIAGVSQDVARQRLLNAACQVSSARFSALRRRRAIEVRDDELRDLTRVGIGLMAERDRTALLEKIIDVGKRLTASDAGLLILAETGDRGEPCLRLALWACDSLHDLSHVAGVAVAIDDTSIVGHAAATKELMVIEDAYNLPPDARFAQNPLFDEQLGYYRKSMLIVPMVDHVDHLVGLLLFVNRKTDVAAKITDKEAADRYVLSYTARDVRVARSLGAHAAISIENAELYARIERTLESFVKAAVTAIDQRDPTTAGHSVRVAALATELARAVDRADHGALAGVRFTRAEMRELYFASLLHDFGKVSVRDGVLMKAKKLPPALWERIDARFDLIHRTLELDHHRKCAGTGTGARHAARPMVADLDLSLAEELEHLERLRQIVIDANQPEILPKPPHPALLEMAGKMFERPDGTMAPYLTQDELHFLCIPQGSLDERERAEMEAHVAETNRFLADVPWTDELRNLVAYAYGHHEKLNGTGYPRRVRAEDIPIQTRMITIADVFDALTESDRPYKQAVSADAALDIMREEADAGSLDADLVRLLVDTKAYRRILDQDWRRF